jgi:hypothetical protein
MKKQEWVCEVCGLSGVVQHDEHTDVLSVVYAIEDHHDHLARQHAPHCRFDVHKVRVRNSELTDIYAWNRLCASLEKP